MFLFSLLKVDHWLWNKCAEQFCMSLLSGLPMVVEDIPGFRRLSILCPHLRHLLLCQQGENPRGCSSYSVDIDVVM